MKQAVARTPLRLADSLGTRASRTSKTRNRVHRLRPAGPPWRSERHLGETSFDQKPGSNLHETASFPRESETSLVKSVRGGGRGIRPRQGKKKRNPRACQSLRLSCHSSLTREISLRRNSYCQHENSSSLQRPNNNPACQLVSQIGLWLLSGAVLWQTVQVFQPSVSTLKN